MSRNNDAGIIFRSLNDKDIYTKFFKQLVSPGRDVILFLEKRAERRYDETLVGKVPIFWSSLLLKSSSFNLGSS